MINIKAKKKNKIRFVLPQFYRNILINSPGKQMEKDYLHVSKQQQSKIDPTNCININVGVLGHVDSGKTSLCRILSEITSTASLDKNPQSQERGITLDLGFSAFLTKMPQKFTNKVKQQYLQFTLVDCPGHGSLLKTIIGGAQIIDIMLLVVDITKGIQTQTAECIIIAELFVNKLIVVLNKVDMLEDQKQIDSKINALRKVFGKTKFGQDVFMIPISTKQDIFENVSRMKQCVIDNLQELPQRKKVNKNFLLMIDHCFKIKGKGNIVTGTVVEGKIKIGDQIEICQIQQKGKIKSIQMFRKPLNSAKQGDRIALLVTQIQSEKIERGLACIPGSLKQINKFVMDLNIIRLYKRPIKNKAKFHIISGHQTVMSELRLFYSKDGEFTPEKEYLLINQIEQGQQLIKSQTKQQGEKPNEQNKIVEKKQQPHTKSSIYAIVTLEKQMYLSLNDHVVGYKFDVDIEEKMCRIAFHGKIKHAISEDPKSQVKLYKQKHKTGVVDRLLDNYTIIVKDLFSKDFLDIKEFIGKQITIEGYENQKGKIDGSFGKSGKVRVLFKNVIQVPQIQGKQVFMNYIKWYH